MPRGLMVRLLLMGTLLAAVVYVFFFFSTPPPIVDPTESLPSPLIVVPEIDRQLLAQVEDDTREQRLLQPPPEPFKELLRVAIDVNSEAVAKGLGMPDQPIPVEAVRSAPDHMRGRWLWYKGRIEDLNGPRRGHPLEKDGYSIYEATIRLDSGEHVLAAFSMPPGAGIGKGAYAMVSGFMLMLRDTTYPTAIGSAPLLIGRQIKRSYADWAPVTQLDPKLLGALEDGEVVDGVYQPSSGAWRGLEDEQDTPLWHLAAYARDNQLHWGKAEWRQLPTVNSKMVWDDLRLGKIERGTPMRILGTVAQLPHTWEAAPNPAGITHWSEVWVQVRDLGGKTFPIWVPDTVHVNIKDGLEVRGWFFKRYAYEPRRGGEVRTAVFVAGGIDLWQGDVDPMLKSLGIAMGGAITLLVVWIYFGQRKERARSAAVQDHLIARRRKRRGVLATAEARPQPPS